MDQHETITGDSTMQTIIKGISLIDVSIPTNMQAVANTRGATISEYVIEGLHVKYNASGTSLQLVQFDENSKPIYETYSQKDHVLIYAVDSRGTSSLPYEQKFTKYIPYEPVTVNGKTRQIGRQNNGISRFIDVTFEGTWWNGNFGALQNELIPIVYYRDAEDGYWTDLNEFVEGAEVGQIDMSLVDTSTPGVFKYSGPVSSNESDKGFDVSVNYDMLIGFWDLLTNMVLIVTVPYGEPAIAVYKNKAALGGPYDEQLGGTQLWGDIYVNGEPHGSGGSVTSDDVYSTEETVIGKWIDNKPLYRKVTVLDPEFIKGDNHYSTGISNIDVVVDSTLHFKYNSKWYITWDALYNREYIDNGARYMISSTSPLSLQYMFLITEYTKTTD